MLKIPFGSEFSPNQIDLPEILSFCKLFEGQSIKLKEEIYSRYFQDNKRAGNCISSLKNYGIIDIDCNLTDLGRKLYSLKDKTDELYKCFARHILLNLNGMGCVQCCKDMAQASEKITLETVRPALEIRGFTFPRGSKDLSMMRLWLSMAGVFSKNDYSVNDEALTEILGSNQDMSDLRKLTKEQRFFILALLNTGVQEFQPASGIAKLASTTYGVSYPEKTLPKDVLAKIESLGYIEIQKATQGRGAKSHLCRPTEKAKKDVLEPIIHQLETQADPQLIVMLNKSITEILVDIESNNTYTKGIALEALAFKLLSILGLSFVINRGRSDSTGGNEVDLLFHSDRLIYSRWQVQCKNTKQAVSIDHVAREVGLLQILYSNVIVIITTGTVSSKARDYANHVMKNSNVNIVFIDKNDIAQVANNPIVIVDIFNREAKKTMQIKKIDFEKI